MLQILLVDDENDALEALEWKLNNYIENVEVKTCNSPIKAIDIINNEKPDVVFLDIQMPEMDGFTMIEKLQNKDFNLIFTTAHDEFALKAIKVSAIDYLLKPVDKDELLAAMDKIQKGGFIGK
jgi:two-component system LytT family response regulator